LGQGGSISVLLEALNIREQALGLVDAGAVIRGQSTFPCVRLARPGRPTK
jgi:hypothetical protein